MEGVSSALILRNQSWVRQQAQALVRRLPANVEKADLIQVGLIAVAQAATSFVWEGDRESDEANQAFVRYAQMRVKGAMLDELRHMDRLPRGQRRKLKAVQVATERWIATHGVEPSACEIAAVCGLEADDVFELKAAARAAQETSLAHGDSDDDEVLHPEPATERDEVEARVDTEILLRRLEGFFATLPERDRQVIDSYLGIGLPPTELAKALNVTPSRVSQLFRSAYERIGMHLGHPVQRSTDRDPAETGRTLDERVARRKAEMARDKSTGPWDKVVESALQFSAAGPDRTAASLMAGTKWP